jgi:hypothetical protein
LQPSGETPERERIRVEATSGTICFGLAELVLDPGDRIQGGCLIVPSVSTNRIAAHVRCCQLVALAVLVVLVGCSKTTWPTVVPVSGRVLKGGEPVTHGTVTFYPDRAKGNDSTFQPFGFLDGSGRYQLASPSTQGVIEGAPPGWYRVSVSSAGAPRMNVEPVDPGAAKAHKTLGKYEKPQTSGLAVQVVPDAPADAYDLDLGK